MVESTSVTDQINTLNTLFSQLTSLSQIIAESERAKLLLQSLPDSYDQLIIKLINRILSDFLVFEDVASAVLEEEDKWKNKEDRLASSQQVEALTITRERSMERGSSGSQNMVDQNQGVKRMLNATTVAKDDISRISVGYSRRIEISNGKVLSWQILRGV